MGPEADTGAPRAAGPGGGTPISRHRLLRADAGTGKTYALTVHFLRLLESGVDPRRVLATTFTRKAAGEILQRVLRRVAEAVLSADRARALSADLDRGASLDAEAFSARLADLVSALPRLSVGTLDSFFRRLVSSFRYELGLARMRHLAAPTDPLVQDLRRIATGRALDDLASATDTLGELSRRLYRGQAQRSVAWAVDRVVLELHGLYRETPEASAWTRIEIPPGLLDEEELEVALTRWRDATLEAVPGGGWGEPVSSLPRKMANAVRTHRGDLESRNWKSFLGGGLAGKVDEHLRGDGAECTFDRRPVPDAIVEATAPLVRHARAVLIREVAEQTVATHRLLEAYDRRFTEQCREHGVVLFSDLAELVARGLEALDLELRLSVAYRMDGSVEHVLLDEFQDTSTLQWLGLSQVVEEVLSWGDGSRSLFTVGDPKQSIYGWRGGRPELFDVVARRLAPLAAEGAASLETLQRSYRTRPLLLGVVNRIFGGLAHNPAFAEVRVDDDLARRRAVEAWAKGFEEHESAVASDDGEEGYVVLRTSEAWERAFAEEGPPDPEAAPEEGTEEAEPLGHIRWVAERVREIVDRLPGARVGVLTRTNRVVGESLVALRSAGVAASGEGQGRIVDDPVVTGILSAFRLAAWPADTVSLVHLAGSPLGDLLGIDPRLALPAAPGELASAAEAASSRLRLAVAERGACALLAEWSRRLEERLPPRSRARLQQAVEVLLAERERVDRSPDEVVRWLAEASVEEPAPAAVRVMTVHQAKGLEFDVVVLCELETRLGLLNNPLVNVLRENALSAPSAVVRATSAVVRESSPLLRQAHAQEIERQVRDDLGVVYVALTRARHELHLLVQPAELSSKGELANSRNTVAGMLRGALLEPGDLAAAEPERVLFEAGRPLASWPAPGPAAEAVVGPPPLAARSGGVRGAVSRRRRPLREVVVPDLGTAPSHSLRGSLLHGYLAQVIWLGRRGHGIDAASRRRIEHAIAPGADVSWLDRVWRDFEAALTRPRVAELLQRPSQPSIVWRERPFALVVGREGAIRRGVFDRVVLIGDGEIEAAEVLDFKTGSGSERVDGRPRSEAYRDQLRGYREAVAALTGLMPTAIRARLVWLDLGEVEEV